MDPILQTLGINESDHRRWRAALEKLDPATVRAKLDYGHAGRALHEIVEGIVTTSPHPSREFVEAWIAEKTKASDDRDLCIKYAALALGGLGAVIGLVALVHHWS